MDEDGSIKLMGRTLNINWKTQKVREKMQDSEKKCWFCYENEEIEKHLIIKSFEHFYIALPKGPINELHLLIVPKKHISNSLMLSEEE